MKKTLAIISIDSPSDIKEALLRDGFDVLLLPPSPHLQTPVRSHADMLIFPIGDTVFCHESYASENQKILSRFSNYGYNIITVDGDYREDYPYDVRFNIARIGKNILLGSKTCADEICEYATQKGFEITRVNQGYTKCSTCIISDKAIITADSSIEAAALKVGIDVLRIREGEIDLYGYSYGFIGGASGAYDDTVYFVGDVRLHPDGESILNFCEKHNKKISFIENKKLFDIGSIIFLPNIL